MAKPCSGAPAIAPEDIYQLVSQNCFNVGIARALRNDPDFSNYNIAPINSSALLLGPEMKSQFPFLLAEKQSSHAH
jgi:hypothetical protein